MGESIERIMLVQEGNPGNPDERRKVILEAFGKKVEIVSPPNDAIIPGNGKNPPKSISEAILEAFGVTMKEEELILESLGVVTLDEAVLVPNGSNLEEDWRITGTLVDSNERTLNGQRLYPLSVLEKAIQEKVWRNSQIFLSHLARGAKDLTKLCGKVSKLWLDDGKLKFQALLSSRIVDKIAGLADALREKLIGISMASRGHTKKDPAGETVTDLSTISFDLLTDKKSTPAALGSGIENVQEV